MISLNEITKIIDSSPTDGKLYLIDKCSATAGFFVANKNIIYMAKNDERASANNLQTDYLILRSNAQIASVENFQHFNSGYYNLLEYKVPYERNPENFKSFINLCVAHIKFMKSQNFIEFFNSLIDLFQLTTKEKAKNILGLFGELSLISYFYSSLNFNLAPFWHTSGTYSKYDFSLTEKNIEVKTTTSLKEVLIKHTQIFNNDKNYLTVAVVENSNSGTTLEELIESLLKIEEIKSNFNFILNLETEKARIYTIDYNSKRLKLVKVNIFNCDEINPLENIPKNISNIEYRIDLTMVEKTQPETLIE